VIFVFRYSSINIIKNVLDVARLRSSKDRPITDQRLLDYNKESSLILQLHGFIFFGTANSLYEQVKLMVAEKKDNLKYLLMDMGLVQGIDSSAVKSFEKLMQHLEKNNISLALVNIPSSARQLFEANGIDKDSHSGLYFFKSMNETLEWCEDNLLTSEKENMQKLQEDGDYSGNEFLQAVYGDMMAALDVQILFETVLERASRYTEKISVNENEVLYKQGDDNSDLYFISRGQVALLESEGEGHQRRVRTLGPWSITGELGAFLGYHSSHDAVVTKKGVIYKLPASALNELENDDKVLTADLHKLIIQVLGGQLSKTSRVTEG
jgi:SulP family sulfate permease